MNAPPDSLPPMLVLAGGLGTRLRGRIGNDLPKVLAPVHGRPFVDYLLAWCGAQGLGRVGFALGHRAEAVIDHLRASAAAQPFATGWCVEPEPRGTAGGLALALAELLPDGGPCLVMNGDTLVEVDLHAFRDGFGATGAEVGLVAAAVPDAGRYGALVLDGDCRVRRFAEKDPAPAGAAGEAWINAGIYLLSPRFQDRLRGIGRGSLERDLFARLPAGAIWAFKGARRFLDIGTDASLDEAQRVLAPLSGGHDAVRIWRDG